MLKQLILALLLSTALFAQEQTIQNKVNTRMEQATFAAGCFWCVEAIFSELKGVSAVVSGYAGGANANPSYEEVCSGQSGHAEVCRIDFDPAQIAYEELLEVFWKTHDPTTLNRQGADRGTQYRSAIFYHTDAQRQTAQELKNELNEAGIWSDPIVTEIVPISNYSSAEKYHQDYFEQNSQNAYCRNVIIPKVQKFRKIFADKLRRQ